MLPNPQFPADLVTFTEEILNGKLHFLCSVILCMNFLSSLQTTHKNEVFLQELSPKINKSVIICEFFYYREIIIGKSS